MGQPRSPQGELYKRWNEILHEVWDPIGGVGLPAACDAYEGYLPQAFGLVRDAADAATIVEYLVGVAQQRMELAGDRERAMNAAPTRVDCRERIGAGRRRWPRRHQPAADTRGA